MFNETDVRNLTHHLSVNQIALLVLIGLCTSAPLWLYFLEHEVSGTLPIGPGTRSHMVGLTAVLIGRLFVPTAILVVLKQAVAVWCF